jgi:hypothetical protein
MGEGRSAYRILVGKLEGKRPSGRPGHIWEPIDLQQIRRKVADWTDLTHDSHKWRAVVSVMMEL